MTKIMKIFKWLIISVLVLFIAGLGLVYLAPGYDVLLIRSQSMEPNVGMGDLIVIGPLGGPVNGTIEPGMIVTYYHGEDTITHRVASIDGETLTMKGDALQHPDPWSVSVSDVKGIYLFKVPFVGYAVNFTRTKVGWFLAIIVPAIVLVGWLCWDILKEAFRDGAKNSKKKENKVPVKQAVNKQAVKKTFSEPRKSTNENIRGVLIEALNNAYEASKDGEVKAY